MFVYNYIARCLGSQSTAALPCLTHRVEQLAVFPTIRHARRCKLIVYVYATWW